jgi:hypothetical protein
MARDLVKKIIMAVWAAAIILLVGGFIGYKITGLAIFGYISMAYFIIINLIALTLIIIIVVRLKEWIERQVAVIGSRKDAITDSKADLVILRQSIERIEKKVDTIETILENVAE